MATYLENLKTRRDAIGVELAAMGATKAGGNPNSSLEGGGVDHQGYKAGLLAELKTLNEMISVAEPVEVETIGLSE
ncbi:hypothetical protein [uncultured Mediterranean phage uvDeep-CGR2-KM19-C37]|nr:hypothetical protein [uncultured Mediterranean phage uvDeep-CGR2-KM19-C37]